EAINTARTRFADNPARAAGDLGHGINPEMLDDLVERPRDRRQAGKLLDQRVAAGYGLAAFDGLAVTIDGVCRHITLAIGEGFIELHREGMGEVVEDVICRVGVMLSSGFQGVVLLIHFRVSALDNHDASAPTRRRTSAHELPLDLSARRSCQPSYASLFRALCWAGRKRLGGNHG